MVFSTKGVHMIEPWTNQTAAVAGLLGIRAQGYQRSTRGGLCLYRGPRGLKCYIGHLIPDELYDLRFEGKGCKIVLHRSTIADTGLFTNVDFDLLIYLQQAHDMSLQLGVMQFELEVKRIFEKYDLEYPAP